MSGQDPMNAIRWGKYKGVSSDFKSSLWSQRDIVKSQEILGKEKKKKKEQIASNYEVKNLPNSLSPQETPKAKVHHSPFFWS